MVSIFLPEKSKKKHIPLKEHYKSIERLEAELEATKGEYQKLLKLKEYYPKLKETIVNLLEETDKLFGMLETKELTVEERNYLDTLSKKISVKTPQKPKPI